jgi:hypothetical protein
MAEAGRKPLIPDKFFEEHLLMPYKWAKPILDQKYGVEVSEEEYYRRMSVIHEQQAGRGRNPLVPDYLFVMHSDITDPEALAQTLTTKHHKSCDAAYAQRRMTGLGFAVEEKKVADLETITEKNESVNAKMGRPQKVADYCFLDNKDVYDPEAMAKAINETYGIKCSKAYARKRMHELNIKTEDRRLRQKPKPEPKKKGRKSAVPDAFLIEHSDITSPEEMALLVKQQYGIGYGLGYMVVKMRKVGINPELKGRNESTIPESFFKKYSNLCYDEAQEKLREEGITDVSRSLYNHKRYAYRKDIPEMKDLRGHGRDTRILIPEQFFVEHPNLYYHDAVKILKKDYRVEGVTNSYYNRRRNVLKDKMPQIGKLKSRILSDKKPEKKAETRKEPVLEQILKKELSQNFFEETKDLPTGVVQDILKKDYSIEMSTFDVLNKRRENKLKARRLEKISQPRESSNYTCVTGKMKDTSKMDGFQNQDWIPNLDDLSVAVIKKVGEKHKMELDDAKKIAESILNFFGNEIRIIDNVLWPDDRDPFYMLEDVGLLTTENDWLTLYDGREWRINYWLLHVDNIVNAVKEQQKKEKKESVKEDVYSELPEEAWANGSVK